ncbi:hypothetical protein [Streptomyces hainanensis]|uniref:Uncharacterized protein n=1 Tax=Streptomyces hainanensis TaxID=402648 RepID=A0A4R4SNZ7_9ACTN|nr:hypothetical protein [Streptomyces hainanensis]TDC65528.1 hypothetical protein E1283_30590 [Streptomyces hainanensis]
MTTQHPNSDDDQDHEPPLRPEIEQGYRDEFRVAMNAVVQYCRNVVNEHGHRGLWAPRGNSPDHYELISQARRDILTKLRLVLDCAETIAYEIERDRKRPHRRQPE